MKAGWEIFELENACSVDYGTRVVRKRDQGTVYPVYGGGGETFFLDSYNRENQLVIARFGMSERCTRFVSGKFFLNDSGLTVSPRDLKKIDRKFLDYLMISKNNEIYSMGRGTAQKNLDVDAFKKMKIPVPPDISEQKRIVAILDEAFAGIDQAIANTEKNLASARELFGNFISDIFSSKDNGWVNCTIGDVCTLKSGTTVPKDIEKSDGDIPYVKVAEMTMDENVDGIITSIRFLNNDDIKKSWVIPAGSTIFPKRGGAILTNKKRILLKDACLDLNIMAVLPSDKILPEFLYIYFLNVDMSVLGSGSSIPQINNPDISPLKFAFPINLEDQKKIFDRFNIVRAEYLKLHENYEGKLALLNELKQSLLQKAFSGELTTDTVKLAEAAE